MGLVSDIIGIGRSLIKSARAKRKERKAYQAEKKAEQLRAESEQSFGRVAEKIGFSKTINPGLNAFLPADSKKVPEFLPDNAYKGSAKKQFSWMYVVLGLVGLVLFVFVFSFKKRR